MRPTLASAVGLSQLVFREYEILREAIATQAECNISFFDNWLLLLGHNDAAAFGLCKQGYQMPKYKRKKTNLFLLKLSLS
jgi:hypothetical protein